MFTLVSSGYACLLHRIALVAAVAVLLLLPNRVLFVSSHLVECVGQFSLDRKRGTFTQRGPNAAFTRTRTVCATVRLLVQVSVASASNMERLSEEQRRALGANEDATLDPAVLARIPTAAMRNLGLWRELLLVVLHPDDDWTIPAHTFCRQNDTRQGNLILIY